MRAIAVTPRTRGIGIVEQPEPRLATTHDVKLRILEVGVCGTDREICAFDYGTPPPGSDHLVIGHESLAEVIEVGRDVSRVAVGDLVVPTVRRPCAHPDCLPCATSSTRPPGSRAWPSTSCGTSGRTAW